MACGLCVGREAKCPYVLLLRRHCPLPDLVRKPPRPLQAATCQPEVLTADEPRLTGASAKSMSLDLKLDYQFDSPPASQGCNGDHSDAGIAVTAAHFGEDGSGRQLRVHRGSSKTASDPVRMPTCCISADKNVVALLPLPCACDCPGWSHHPLQLRRQAPRGQP